MRPLEQADPDGQQMLVERANRPGGRGVARAATPGGARRQAVSDALAAAAFTRLFPFVPLARTTLQGNHGRAGPTLAS
jgi:hypothetical protein